MLRCGADDKGIHSTHMRQISGKIDDYFGRVEGMNRVSYAQSVVAVQAQACRRSFCYIKNIRLRLLLYKSKLQFIHNISGHAGTGKIENTYALHIITRFHAYRFSPNIRFKTDARHYIS